MMTCTAGGAVKIGFTDDVERRRQQLEATYGRPLAVLAAMGGGRQEEGEIHGRFAHLRFGRTEQFRPGPDLMAFIGRPLLVGANPDAAEAMPATSGEKGVRHARIELPDDDYQRLKAAADRYRISVAAAIRMAVLEWVERIEAKGESK